MGGISVGKRAVCRVLMNAKICAGSTQIFLFRSRHQIAAELQRINPIFLEFPLLVYRSLNKETVVENDLMTKQREIFREV